MKKCIAIVFSVLCLSCLARAGTLTLVSPNGGESWKLDSIQPITWSASGISQKVKLALYKDGVWIGQIADRLDVGAPYSWTVGRTKEGDAAAGGGYTIRVRTQDNVMEDASDAAFTISGGTAPVLVRLPPNRPLPSDILKFPGIKVSDVGLVNNRDGDGFEVIFIVKNSGTAAWPKGPPDPSFRVLIEGRELASGTLPNYLLAPGQELGGIHGGEVHLPVAGSLVSPSPGFPSERYEAYFNWHVGEPLVIRANENRALGMSSDQLTRNLRPMLLEMFYDLSIASAAFDWSTRKLKVKAQLDGSFPAYRKYSITVAKMFDTNYSQWFDELFSGGNTASTWLIKRVEIPDNVKEVRFRLWLLPDEASNEVVRDIDLRNNQFILISPRPQ